MSPETSVAVRVGTSLVPLMVISMSCEEVPLPSSTVMVKVDCFPCGQEVEAIF